MAIMLSYYNKRHARTRVLSSHQTALWSYINFISFFIFSCYNVICDYIDQIEQSHNTSECGNGNSGTYTFDCFAVDNLMHKTINKKKLKISNITWQRENTMQLNNCAVRCFSTIFSEWNHLQSV